LSATNKNLSEEAKKGQFREDLLYRINVFTLELPPLRKRSKDIPYLIDNFIKKRFGEINAWEISEDALKALSKYDWPGNVRELENVIERAIIIAEEQTIQLKDLALSFMERAIETGPEKSGEIPMVIGNPVAIREVEKAHIVGVLNSVGWDKKLAAKILDINLKTLYIKIQTYGLKN
jgi:DNA-binding NtrC family response regulator